MTRLGKTTLCFLAILMMADFVGAQQQAVVCKMRDAVLRVGFCDFNPDLNTNMEYIVTNSIPQEIDTTYKYVAVSNIFVKMTDEELGDCLQARKSVVLRVVENRFINWCDILTGSTNHVKYGFATLQEIITSIPDLNQQVLITVQLLAIDAEAKREGNLDWWDTCVWHPEVEQYMAMPMKTLKAVVKGVPVSEAKPEAMKKPIVIPKEFLVKSDSGIIPGLIGGVVGALLTFLMTALLQKRKQ